MASNTNSLLELIFNLKKENLNLQQQIADITIECNKMMRNK